MRLQAALLTMLLAAAPAHAQPVPTNPATWPTPTEGDYIAQKFRFQNGATLPSLRLHYATLGTPHRDAAGHVDNAVMVLHGTGGSSQQFIRPQFAGVLFVPGGLLDPAKYSLFYRTELATANPPSRATACTQSSPPIPTTTWCGRNTSCSPTACTSTICA